MTDLSGAEGRQDRTGMGAAGSETSARGILEIVEERGMRRKPVDSSTSTVNHMFGRRCEEV